MLAVREQEMGRIQRHQMEEEVGRAAVEFGERMAAAVRAVEGMKGAVGARAAEERAAAEKL